MEKQKLTDHRITVSFTEDLNQKIEMEAYYKALPKSAVIRLAVMEHFSDDNGRKYETKGFNDHNV